MGRISEIFGHKPDGKTFERDDFWPLPTCRIGIEQELEGFNDTQASLASRGLSAFWSTHRDDSLRNGGLEFVTDPVFGADLSMAIDSFRSYLLDTLKAKPTATKRCGFHVHIDARDMSLEELITMLGIYTIFEKPLFRIAGEGRSENIFCVPFYKAQTLQYEVSRSLTNDASFRQVASLYNEAYRYAAVNFGALEKFGTLEFRHKKATLDPQEMREWIALIMCLKRWSMDKTYINLPEFVSGFGMHAFIAEVFGGFADSLYRVYPTRDDLVKDCMFGVREAQAWLRLHSVGEAWWKMVAAKEIKHKWFKSSKPKRAPKKKRISEDVIQEAQPGDEAMISNMLELWSRADGSWFLENLDDLTGNTSLDRTDAPLWLQEKQTLQRRIEGAEFADMEDHRLPDNATSIVIIPSLYAVSYNLVRAHIALLQHAVDGVSIRKATYTSRMGVIHNGYAINGPGWILKCRSSEDVLARIPVQEW